MLTLLMILEAIYEVSGLECGTWTLMQADRSKLEAFEMWIWRRMEKISWEK